MEPCHQTHFCAIHSQKYVLIFTLTGKLFFFNILPELGRCCTRGSPGLCAPCPPLCYATVHPRDVKFSYTDLPAASLLFVDDGPRTCDLSHTTSIDRPTVLMAGDGGCHSCRPVQSPLCFHPPHQPVRRFQDIYPPPGRLPGYYPNLKT